MTSASFRPCAACAASKASASTPPLAAPPFLSRSRFHQMVDVPRGWPPSFEDEAYRLIGRIIAAWSDIHEHIHGQIGATQTLIYILQARAWRAANAGQSHFGRVEHPREIPDSKFKLRFRYFRRLKSALNYNDKKVVAQLAAITSEVWRVYDIRNKLAHSRIQVSGRHEDPAVTLTSHSWIDDWRRIDERAPKNRNWAPPTNSILMTQGELEQAHSDMQALFLKLLAVPTPFNDAIKPPEHPKRPS